MSEESQNGFDDIKEFKAEADKFVSSNKSHGSTGSPSILGHESEEKKEKQNAPERLCQWSYNGPGYVPVSQTSKQIPPSIYEIKEINRLITIVPKGIRTDKLIRLPDSKSEDLIKQVQNFWNLKKEFKEGNEDIYGGYLHKRGYMLYGPPGSGKTSTAHFIMQGIVERGGIVLLGNTHPSYLSSAMSNVSEVEPNREMVVILEDFDDLIQNYGEAKYLSILDGEDNIDNVLFIATTNYPSRLDPRVYNRPGRFNDVVKIGMPNADARRVYLSTKLKKHDLVEKIVAMTEGFSIDHMKALVQSVFLEKKDLEKEVLRLQKLFIAPKDDQGALKGVGIL